MRTVTHGGHPQMVKKLEARLESMNAHFGAGDLLEMEVHWTDSENGGNAYGHVMRKRTSCKPEKRRFSIFNGVLRFARHESTLARPFRI
jgi:hypothetical protein